MSSKDSKKSSNLEGWLSKKLRQVKSVEIPPDQPKITGGNDVGELSPKKWNRKQKKRHKKSERNAKKRDKRHVSMNRWLIALTAIAAIQVIGVFWTPHEVRGFFCDCEKNSSTNESEELQTSALDSGSVQLRVRRWQEAYRRGFQEGLRQLRSSTSFPENKPVYFLIPRQ